MTKKIVFGVALALVIVGIAAPSASAACNPPKAAATYNTLTGGYSYWHSPLAALSGAALVGKMWSGTVDFTGTCNDGTQQFLYFGATPGDVGLNISLGEACVPGCPSGSLSVMATVSTPTGTEFLTTQATETPAGGLNFDYSNTSHPMVPLPRPRVTSSTRVAPNVNLGIAVDATAGGYYEGTASQITGYNILSAASVADPGRLASAYSLRQNIPAPGGTAGTAPLVSVDCSDITKDQWVVTQIVTLGGASPSVSAATRVKCNQALADPKYKIVPKKGPITGTISN